MDGTGNPDEKSNHPKKLSQAILAEVASQLPSKAVLKTTLYDLANDTLQQRSHLTGERQDQKSVYHELNRIMADNGFPPAHLEHRAVISDKNLPRAWNNVAIGQTFNLYDGASTSHSTSHSTRPEGQTSLNSANTSSLRERLRQDIINETSTVPVARGEGYYQVLKRMKPALPDELVSKEAHRIKAINHHKDVLNVGERLATATLAQRQRELEKRLANHAQNKTTETPPKHGPTTGPSTRPEAPAERPSNPSTPSTPSTPFAPATPAAPLKPEPPGPPNPTKPGPSDRPLPEQPIPIVPPPRPAATTLADAYAAERTNYDHMQGAFTRETQSQGFIGRVFDAAKNHIGTSGDGKAWYDPRRIWSSVFDKDLGSDAVKAKLNAEGQELASLKIAADTKDESKFQTAYKDLTGSAFEPASLQAAPLKGNKLVTAYDDSQRSGVDTTTDIASGLAAVASLKFKGAGMVGTLGKASLAGVLIGGTTKSALMQADGKYANFPRDFAMGSIMGGTVPLSELGGSQVSRFAGKKMGMTVTGDLLTARIETQGMGFGTRLLSAGLKSGTSAAIFGAIESPSHEVVTDIEKHKAIEPLTLAGLSVKGAAFGFVGGTALGGVSDRLVDAFHVKFPGKLVAPRTTIQGVDIPSSGAVGLEDASKILKIKPDELLEKATKDPYGAVKDAVHLYETTGLNVKKVDALTGKPSVPTHFSDALTTVQNVELLTTDSGVKLTKKVEIVQAADSYLKNNPEAVDAPLQRVTSDPNYKKVVQLIQIKEAGDSGSASAFEQQFKQGFEQDLKTNMAVRRVQNGSLSEADALAQSTTETEAAYKQKAADFFKDMTDPAQRRRLNTLVDEIYDKFNPELVSKTQLREILETVPKKDRPLATALMQESAGSSSDTALAARLKSLRSDIEAKTGSASPDNVYTLAPNSSGNLIGYLYRKSNSMSMSINNIDKLAQELKSGNIPHSIVLFDDLASTEIAPATKELLKKIPKVYVVDLGAFEKGVNILDFSKGPQAVETKLSSLLEEAKAIKTQNAQLLPTGVARQLLSGSVDDAAKAIGSNVEIIRPSGNPLATAQLPGMQKAATLDQLYTELNAPKSSKEEIASFLSKYAGQEREIAARMIAEGAVHNSFPVMVKKAVALHEGLTQTLAAKGLSMKDVVMVSDKDPGGSSHLVTYLFGNANGLPEANFVSSQQLDQLLRSGAAKNKVLAYFDDTIYSGSQTSGMLNANIASLSPFKRVVVAGLGAYDQGVSAIQATHLGKLGKVDVASPTKHYPFYSDQHPFYAQLAKPQQSIVKTIGGSDGFGSIQGSLIWPYMYPDNNISFFGSQFSGSVLHLPGP